MKGFFPFLEWLQNYKRSFFSKDLLAGVTVGIILVPQGMAYAMIAGLPPVYGLYASLFPIVVYALLGTSRQLAIGPVAMDSLLVAAGLGTLAISGIENYIAMAMLLAFLVGAMQLLLGFFRMGFLVNFMSKPVISGFTSAAAFIIMFSQLKHLLGTNIPGSNQFHILIRNAFRNIGEANPYDVMIGVLGILFIILLRKFNKKILAILLVVVLGVIAVFAFNLESKGVKLVGNVPKGLPSFKIHAFNLESIKALWPIALAVAFVGYLEAISIGKGIEEKNNTDTIRPNQELIALGTTNIVGSFFQSLPVTASFSRSAINNELGAKTQISSIVSVLLVLITLLFLTPLFYYLPNAVLASIIMVSVFSLIDFSYARSLWENRKDEFMVLLATFCITLFIGIKEGILIGILISLLLMVYRTSKPHFAVLGRIKGTDYFKNINRFSEDIEIEDEVLALRFDSQLYFGNKGFFKTELYRQIEKKGPKLKYIILNAEAINYMDSTATHMLRNVVADLKDRGLEFKLARVNGPLRDLLYKSGLINDIGEENIFVRTFEACDNCKNHGGKTQMQNKIALQSKNHPI
ncbi:SulP family sulfate permease [Saonia flava]|uniref:SulP family sulfate permease n=1 Tax=Saonia flava TaxID=523696 RepID=A0A846R0I4_9FLAO|nr:solute carrier family 26 protein [Saonia flava]NJB72670.1 SulP family sulfate permease [Saonia flava]